MASSTQNILLVGITPDSHPRLAGFLREIPTLAQCPVPDVESALARVISDSWCLIAVAIEVFTSEFAERLRMAHCQIPCIVVSAGEEVDGTLPEGATEIWFENTLSQQDVNRTLRYATLVAGSERRRRLQEFESAQFRARYLNIQSIAHVGYVEYDPSSGKVTWSDEVFRILGFDPQAFEPDLGSFIRLVHPDDRTHYEAARGDLLLRGMPLTQTLRIIRTDGTSRWIQIHASPVAKEDGRLLRIETAIIDLTEVRELEAGMERFFNLADDLFCIASFEGYFLQLNATAERILGYSKEELMNHPFLYFVHPDDVQRTQEEVGNIRADNPTAHFQNRYRCADGTYKWIRWSSTRDDIHQLIYAVATDISETKEAEFQILESKAALQLAHDELERRVEGRTQELQMANRSLHERMLERQMAMGALQEIVGQLEVAKTEAERANSAKSEFLSRMSHELRTPMNSIMGFAQILEMAPLDARQAQRVSHIIKAGQHLLQLINEVLDFARVESGRLRVTPESISADTAILTALDIIRPLAEQNHLELETPSLKPGSYPILADSQRLSQVLLNLLSNATKYNRPQGRIMITRAVTSTGKLRIGVRDTGLGISESDMARLFVPFERLNPENPNVEGTGLGLALSKSLVEAMEGAMGVESTVGVGSEFWLELPMGVPASTSILESAVDAQVGLAAARATILYIEDSVANYQVIENLFLDYEDIFVIGAMQGRLGIDLAKQHQPSLILLDLHLPDIGGEEVLRRLRADPLTARIPIIILSADASPSQIRQLLDLGAQGYLTKPLDLQRVLRVVEEYLI